MKTQEQVAQPEQTLSQLVNDIYVPRRAETGEFRYTFFFDYYTSHGRDSHMGIKVDRLFPRQQLQETPRATITIPYAFHDEDHSSTLMPLLTMLEASTSKTGPLEVLLWANTITPEKSYFAGNPTLSERLCRSYDQMVDELNANEYHANNLRITVNRRFMSPPDCFNQIRADYMDAIILDSLGRNFPPSHPIIWLDADTPFLGGNAIREIIEGIERNDSYFVHGSLAVSGMVPDGQPIRQRSQAERVAELYGRTRRLIDSNLGPFDNRGYVEESGLGMRLDTYLKCGGVGFTGPEIGESRVLLQRAAKYLDHGKPVIEYLPSATVGTSNRLYAHLAETVSPRQLPDMEAGDDYKDFTARRKQTVGTHFYAPNMVSKSSIWAMVDYMAERQEGRSCIDPSQALTIPQREYLAFLIGRWGFID